MPPAACLGFVDPWEILRKSVVEAEEATCVENLLEVAGAGYMNWV